MTHSPEPVVNGPPIEAQGPHHAATRRGPAAELRASISGDFCLRMTCPTCAGDLELMVEGRFSSREHNSLWTCSECPTSQSIRISMVPTRFVAAPGEAEGEPCGTEAAYRRHIRRGEPTDEECRQAHRMAKAYGAKKGMVA